MLACRSACGRHKLWSNDYKGGKTIVKNKHRAQITTHHIQAPLRSHEFRGRLSFLNPLYRIEFKNLLRFRRFAAPNLQPFPYF